MTDQTDWMQFVNQPPNPMNNLQEQIRAHWSHYRPKMYAAMEAEGTLDEAIQNAANQTRAAVNRYVEQRPDDMTAAQALLIGWEIFRGEWAFLTAEPDFDETGEDDPELEAYEARLRRWSAENSVQDIWDEKNERWITPFVWDEEKQALVPTGAWYDGLDPAWEPAEGFEDLYPSYPNKDPRDET